MHKRLQNNVLWEGLPFIVGLVVQAVCFCFPKYRDEYWYEIFGNSDERIVSLGYYLVTIALLILASLILYGLRRYWPPINAPDGNFRIIFISVPAVFLTIVASLLLIMLPSFLKFDVDSKWQEIQKNSS